MLKIDPAAARAIAADSRATIDTFTQSVMQSAALTIACIRQDNSTFSSIEGQRLLEALMETQAGAVQARRKMIAAVTIMRSMKRRSNADPIAVGCPGDSPLTMTVGLAA